MEHADWQKRVGSGQQQTDVLCDWFIAHSCLMEMPENPGLAHFQVETHCPGKWISVDLESGDVFMGSDKGWRRATEAERQEAGQILESPAMVKAADN